MTIKWKLSKKRGNLRPLLTYSIELEEHERSLAMPPFRFDSSIPEPEDPWQDFCYPGQMERKTGFRPSSYYTIEAPSHKGKSWPQTLRLPWRADNRYPEIEASFLDFRSAYEAALEEACSSAPIEEEHCLEASLKTKRLIAPSVAAERFLLLIPNCSRQDAFSAAKVE